MHQHLLDLTKQREDIIASDNQRISLSKQLSLVREVESLGSAMSSHPLNSLSQRYGIFKKNKDNVAIVQRILMEQTKIADELMADYLRSKNEMMGGILQRQRKEVLAIRHGLDGKLFLIC